MSFFLIRHSSSSLFLSSSQRMFARWTSQKWFSSIKTDYYKILGVSNNSTQEQIKKEFHKLAKLHHPDSAENQGDNEKFKEISEAYNVLGDADKRVKYDSDLNLEKQRQASQQQHHQNHTHGFTQSGSHSSHNNHFHKHHEFRRRHQQHDENSERSRTARSSHSDGFDEKEDFGEKQSIWDNLKTVPELWLIAGLFGMLVMRWIYLVHSPNQRGKITMDPFDDDFEVSSEERKNKKIELKPEDVYGMSLAVLDQIYSTGKYELPPKVKANVEEYRNLKGKGNKNDGQQQQQGGNQVEQGKISEIQTENKQLKKIKKEEVGNDNIQTIQQVKPVEKTDSIETPKKSRGFNYAQRFNQKDKAATTIPEKSDSQVTSSDSNQLNQTVIIKESQENKDQAVIDQQKIEQQRKQRQYERQKMREKVEEDQKKGWLPVNRESSIPAFINVGSSQTEEKLNKNIEQQENEKV